MLRWRQEILLLSGVFQYYCSDKDLLLGTSTYYVTRLQFIVVFVSLPSFNLPVELVLCLFSSCSIDHSLYIFCWLFKCIGLNHAQLMMIQRSGFDCTTNSCDSTAHLISQEVQNIWHWKESKLAGDLLFISSQVYGLLSLNQYHMNQEHTASEYRTHLFQRINHSWDYTES